MVDDLAQKPENGAGSADDDAVEAGRVLVDVVKPSLEKLASYVKVNDDDDDGNGFADKEDNKDPDAEPVNNEDDLQAAFALAFEPAGIEEGELTLSDKSDAPRIRVWMVDATGAKQKVPLPKTWSMSEFYMLQDRTLYIEGLQPSNMANDVKLEFKYVGDGCTTSSEKSLTVVRLDLDADANDDGKIDISDEFKEENPGVIVFENWDNDDENPSNTPDKAKPYVKNENDLVPIRLEFSPMPSAGSLRLESITEGNKIKIWTSNTKGTEIILPKKWNLSTENIPTTLYLEGYGESKLKNDIELELSYSTGDNTIFDDTLKITVVKLNLGVAVYRKMAKPILEDYEHTGLVTKYTGKRLFNELNNNENWVITEESPGGIRQCTLKEFIDAKPPLLASCSIRDLSDVSRNHVLKIANECLGEGLGYAYFGFGGVAIDWKGLTWDGTVADIDDLRCDGLVEVSYELANQKVWGKNGTHYLIQDYPSEHNNFGNNAMTEFSPVTQHTSPPSRFVAIELFKQSLFQ